MQLLISSLNYELINYVILKELENARLSIEMQYTCRRVSNACACVCRQLCMKVGGMYVCV